MFQTPTEQVSLWRQAVTYVALGSTTSRGTRRRAGYPLLRLVQATSR